MNQRAMVRFVGNYGMAAVLIVLCAYYAWATLQQQPLAGARGAQACARQIAGGSSLPGSVLIVAGNGQAEAEFARELQARLRDAGVQKVASAEGDPRTARQALQAMLDAGQAPAVIAATEQCALWLPNVLGRMPQLASTRIVTPGTVVWPTFLNPDNLLNVASNIAVIAIIGVGMTMVIITGGIDLSVGSLVAFSAVVVGLLIRRYGGSAASPATLLGASLAAIAAAGLVGAFSGVIIAFFRVPPFIATLSMMQVASGLAYKFASGQSISDIPPSFEWLGKGMSRGIPNLVMLLAGVYVIGWVIMARTRLGRYIYAVGGNAEAARLSGVRVRWVLVIVYITSGVVSGIGGVALASQLKSGSPTYGLAYELYVIAAVVLGGTSLAGGSGKVLGTLIGALIIGVIQNGMNLTGVESYNQKIVLGLVILGAVLLDMLKKRSWRLPSFLIPGRARAGAGALVGEPVE